MELAEQVMTHPTPDAIPPSPSAEAIAKQIAFVRDELRTMQLVAGQASVEGVDDAIAAHDAQIAEQFERWADQLDVVLVGFAPLLAAYDAQATRLAQVEQDNKELRLERNSAEASALHIQTELEAAEQRLAEAEAREHALTAAITALEQVMRAKADGYSAIRYEDVADELKRLAAQGHAERKP